jgi:diguanylate cyclase (GGDEF)-like protein
VNLALGLPRLSRAARRQLASRGALHAWLLDLQRPDSGPALARFLVGRVSEWLPLHAWVVVMVGVDGLEVVGPAPKGRRFGTAALVAANAALRVEGAWSAGSMRAALGTGPDAAAVAWVLRDRQEIAGVLVGIDDAPAPRPPDAAGVGEVLWPDVLEPIGLALGRVRHLDRLQALAAIDDLTGLFNARHLQHTVERELSRLARTRRPLSLLFLDLDAFKRVNDRHGHLLGSLALVEVGHLLRACVRPTDTPVRYGGDEFVVVLPDTGRRDASGVARRIQQRVAAQTFLTGRGVEVRLNVSVGVATLSRPTYAAADLIRTADEAMYWVKRHGRNGTRAVLLGKRARPAATVGPAVGVAKVGPAVPAGRLKRSTTE